MSNLHKGCQKPPLVEAKAKGLWPPLKGTPYRVKDGDNWYALAKEWGLLTKNLMGFNFNTVEPPEVNWYLQKYVGCSVRTKDRCNWRFSATASPGIIYRPPKGWDPYKIPGDPIIFLGPIPEPYDPIELPELMSSMFSIRVLGSASASIRKGIALEGHLFQIRNDTSRETVYYRYLAFGFGNSVLPASISTDGPWNSFRTSAPILEIDFEGLTRLSQISAGPFAKTVLHLMGTPEGVDSVYLEDFKTGIIGDAGGSVVVGKFLLLDHSYPK